MRAIPWAVLVVCLGTVAAAAQDGGREAEVLEMLRGMGAAADGEEGAKLLVELGALQQARGDLSGSAGNTYRALRILETRFGREDPVLVPVLTNLIGLELQSGAMKQAMRLADRMTTIAPAVKDATEAGWLHFMVGSARQAGGARREAEEAYQRALGLWESGGRRDGSLESKVRNNLAMMYAGAGRRREAREQLEALVRGAESEGRVDEGLVKPLTNLGALLYLDGRHGEAEAVLARAYEIAASRAAENRVLLGQVAANYAVVLEKRKQKERSRQMMEVAKRALGEIEQRRRHTVDVLTLLPAQ
ncbi:MAG: tetratricopeptide repeat protein [Bryobacteraceae bacterium]|nr:tetratricopeptide repeat protein [Bryobacteraceae bacterium]